jgi:hypothetical protein
VKLYFTLTHFTLLNLVPSDDIVVTAFKDGVFHVCEFAAEFAVSTILEQYKNQSLGPCGL